MANLVRTITQDGSAIAVAIDSTDMVATMEKIHKPSAVVTTALGQLMTATSMMGVMLKQKKNTLTLRINGGGPIGSLLVVGNSDGEVKATADHFIVELPSLVTGKLDVANAVGGKGTMSVSKDMGQQQPYVGQVTLISGEIAQNITHYFATSEQIPTICGLGVLVNPDLSVGSAGGYLVQLLPYADPRCVAQLERNMETILPVSSMIAQGLSPIDICNQLLAGMNPEILDEACPNYRCDCNREKVEKALIALGQQELLAMQQEKTTQVQCHFCNQTFFFTSTDLDHCRIRCATHSSTDQ